MNFHAQWTDFIAHKRHRSFPYPTTKFDFNALIFVVVWTVTNVRFAHEAKRKVVQRSATRAQPSPAWKSGWRYSLGMKVISCFFRVGWMLSNFMKGSTYSSSADIVRLTTELLQLSDEYELDLIGISIKMFEFFMAISLHNTIFPTSNNFNIFSFFWGVSLQILPSVNGIRRRRRKKIPFTHHYQAVSIHKGNYFHFFSRLIVFAYIFNPLIWIFSNKLTKSSKHNNRKRHKRCTIALIH